MRILHLEDNNAAKMIMRKILREIAEVEDVSTHKEAIQALGKKDYDLLVSDFVLGDGNTLEFMAQLRANPRFQWLPIIVVSGSLDKWTRGALRQVGVNAAVGKPIDPSSFRELAQRLVLTPTAREITSECQACECVSWHNGEHVVVACPSLNVHAQGFSEREAQTNLRAKLLERGDALPYRPLKKLTLYIDPVDARVMTGL